MTMKTAYCIKKGTERWLPTEECRIIRDEALKSGRYAKGQIGLTSQKFTNGKNKADGYSARVWIMCGIHPEDESYTPYKGSVSAATTSRKRRTEIVELNGNELMVRGVAELKVDFAALVAKSAIWAPVAEHVACGKAAKHPDIRRKKPYEKRGLARVLLQENMTVESLTAAIHSMIVDGDALTAALKAAPPADGTMKVLELIAEIQK